MGKAKGKSRSKDHETVVGNKSKKTLNPKRNPTLRPRYTYMPE